MALTALKCFLSNVHTRLIRIASLLLCNHTHDPRMWNSAIFFCDIIPGSCLRDIISGFFLRDDRALAIILPLHTTAARPNQGVMDVPMKTMRLTRSHHTKDLELQNRQAVASLTAMMPNIRVCVCKSFANSNDSHSRIQVARERRSPLEEKSFESVCIIPAKSFPNLHALLPPADTTDRLQA